MKLTDKGAVVALISNLRLFTKKSIVRMFEEYGDSVKKIEGINGVKSLKFRILNLLLFGFLKETSFLQFAVCARPAGTVKK
ncbi:MAG: hypothetical protein LLG37_06205 [Spirochaetia bacterium]|nr:hypothetical protein [Spirochaetia bacterium]